MTRALRSALFLALLFIAPFARSATPAKPNIVYILADDMGYGDVSCLNPQSKVQTPNIDRLARQGMAFTEAHSASAVCTPTRYGILTGRYPWRSRLKSGVLNGYSPHLIEPGRLTVPAFLKQQGYATAALGKWHLGMDFAGANPRAKAEDAHQGVNYAKPITHGPTSVGFDSFYGIAASLDMPPFIWIENDHTVGLPTATKKWLREGPAAPDFEAIDVLPTLASRAVEYVKAHGRGIGGAGGGAESGKPFFLYLALASPHTPILPAKEWQGKSGVSPYLDFVMATDDAVGQVLAALDAAGLGDDTLVIFASDNGCSPAAGIAQLRAAGHDPSAGRRGAKADIFDGGHRIPFVARWPGHVRPGSTCDDLICLNDLFATAAEMLGAKLPPEAAEDSVSILPDLLGTATKPVRETVVHASVDGSLAIRQGKWKLEFCPGSGGWSAPHTPKELAGLPPVQLYDVSTDPAEAINVQAAHTDVVDRLMTLLQAYVDNGRSTPGPPQRNDTPVKWRK